MAKMHLVLLPVILDQTGSDTNHSSYSRIAAYLRNQIFSVTYNAYPRASTNHSMKKTLAQ